MNSTVWLLSFSLCLSAAQQKATLDANEHWVATWATAQAVAPVPPLGAPLPRPEAARPQSAPARPSPIGPIPETFKKQTVRMIVRTSIGGRRVRVQLSNAYGNPALTIGAAHIALRQKDAAIVPASDRVLTFAGRASFSIPPGALVVSDPVDLDVPKLTDLAISVYLPEDTGPPTVHPLGLHTTYIAGGDATADATLNPTITTTAYFWLAGVDVPGAFRSFGDRGFRRLYYRRLWNHRQQRSGLAHPAGQQTGVQQVHLHAERTELGNLRKSRAA